MEVTARVWPSPEQWACAVRSARAEAGVWDGGDSAHCPADPKVAGPKRCRLCPVRSEGSGCPGAVCPVSARPFLIGARDLALVRSCLTGEDGSDFLRRLPVTLEVSAPIRWWWLMDQYRPAAATPPERAMSGFLDKEFTFEDFSFESAVMSGLDEVPGSALDAIVDSLNLLRETYEEWEDDLTVDAAVDILPQSYNVTRFWSGTYETLRRICRDFRDSKAPDWEWFIDWIRDNAPYAGDLLFTEGGAGRE